MLMHNYRDRTHIRNAQSAGRNATEEVITASRKTSHELDDIDQRIDRLNLLCEAMWGLIEDNTELTSQDLHKRMTEIDELDGRRDFRRRRVAQPCECGAKVPPTRVSCQFCGAPAALRSLFDIV